MTTLHEINPTSQKPCQCLQGTEDHLFILTTKKCCILQVNKGGSCVAPWVLLYEVNGGATEKHPDFGCVYTLTKTYRYKSPCCYLSTCHYKCAFCYLYCTTIIVEYLSTVYPAACPGACGRTKPRCECLEGGPEEQLLGQQKSWSVERGISLDIIGMILYYTVFCMYVYIYICTIPFGNQSWQWEVPCKWSCTCMYMGKTSINKDLSIAVLDQAGNHWEISGSLDCWRSALGACSQLIKHIGSSPMIAKLCQARNYCEWKKSCTSW